VSTVKFPMIHADEKRETHFGIQELAARDPDSPAWVVGVMLFGFAPTLCQPVPAA